MPARWALVHPGILVRQPYTDDDIDVPKAVASKVRLDEIYPLRPVACAAADAVSIVTDPSQLEQFDLVIDATARTGSSGMSSRRSDARTARTGRT